MLDVPPATPVTTPVVDTTVAIVVVPLVQVPPLVASVNVVVSPWQTLVVPLMAVGSGFTVTTKVA
jgi:hypothetical protein